MSNNINKPMTIIKEEFVSNLTDLINGAMLPAFVIEYILKDMYLEVKNISQKQYEADMKKFNKTKTNKENSDEKKDK